MNLHLFLLPLCYILHRMFKTDQPLGETVKRLMREEGWSFMTRGIASNTTAVAIPVTLTIFLTDLFISFKTSSY